MLEHSAKPTEDITELTKAWRQPKHDEHKCIFIEPRLKRKSWRSGQWLPEKDRHAKEEETGNVETLHAEIDQLEAPTAKLTDDATESTNAWRQPKHDELKCIFIKPRWEKKKLALRATASREGKTRTRSALEEHQEDRHREGLQGED